MKQIEPDTLCYYCLGCNKQELDEYTPVLRCKGFAPDRKDWQEELRKELKNK